MTDRGNRLSRILKSYYLQCFEMKIEKGHAFSGCPLFFVGFMTASKQLRLTIQ